MESINKNVWKHFFNLYKIIFYKLFSFLFFLDDQKFAFLLVSLFIKETNPNSKYTLLVLSSHRFKEETKILSNNFRILELPIFFQEYLRSFFFRNIKLDKGKFDLVFKKSNDKLLEKRKEQFNEYLKKFCYFLFKKKKINMVISPSLHYIQDFFWGKPTIYNKIPYLVIHTECLHASKFIINNLKNRWKKVGNYPLSHLIVYNDVAKKTFIDSKIISPDKISNLGIMRMDKLQKIKVKNVKKQVTFFSFTPGGPGTGYNFSDKRGIYNMFKNTHISFARAAMEHKDFEFIIRPKFADIWQERIVDALKSQNIDIEKINNLRFDYLTNTHELISDSKLIIAYGSTVIFESGFLKKNVLIPIMEEALEKKYSDRVMFKNESKKFDIANSQAEMIKKIRFYIKKNQVISQKKVSTYNKMFKKWVSCYSDSTQRYNKIINKIIIQSMK